MGSCLYLKINRSDRQRVRQGICKKEFQILSPFTEEMSHILELTSWNHKPWFRGNFLNKLRFTGNFVTNYPRNHHKRPRIRWVG